MRDVPDILAKIAAYKVDEVAQIDRDAVEAKLPNAPEPKGFLQALSIAAPPALICEVKKASPSKGVIRVDFDPAAIARAYAAGGATCLSVLTDGPGFQGSLDIFDTVRAATELPLLRKDFMIDVAQVREARAHGADAILIILAMTDDATNRALIAEAEALGMDALVETHTEEEVRRAIDLGATLIGINNRDLHTFDTTLKTFERLAPLVPPHALLVAESGIFTHKDVTRLDRVGAHAFLIGESLMRQDDVEAATASIRNGNDLPDNFCCDRMEDDLTHVCKDHTDRAECSDALVAYSQCLGETYGLWIKDGGSSYVTISFCPWCGEKIGSTEKP